MYLNKIKDFQDYLKKNYKSEETIKAYSRDVKQFLIEYLKTKPIEDIKNKDIEDYKEYMVYQRFLDVKTANKKLVAINQFLTFHQVAVVVRQYKIHNQNFLDDVFETEEVKALIKCAEDNNDLRAKALFMTLELTGMRISECLQISINDIHKDTIMIIGKGNKRRNVFIPDKLRKVWRDYCKVRINKTDMLFTGRKGAINRKTADTIIKKYADMIGIDREKSHLHNFRHYYCKSLSLKGYQIEVISELAGHVDINTSKIYVKRSKKELLDIVNDL